MPLSKENRRLLLLGEFFVTHTWRNLIRSLWLFFPAILFIVLAYFIFWILPQGKDLMVITLENPKGKTSLLEFFTFIVALIFWVYVTWYSTRIVARAKYFQEKDNDAVWEIFRVQAPRVLAFTCITVLILAFFQLEDYGYPHLSFGFCNILLILSYGWYFFLYKAWSGYISQGKREKKQWIIFLKQTRSAAFWSMVWFGLIMMWLKSFWSVILMLLALQIGLVLLMLVRREIDEASTEGEIQDIKQTTPKSNLWQKMKYIILHDENRNYVRLFMIISTIGLCIYLACIVWLRFAVFIGSFPFLLLAFGVLLGAGNIISYLSVLQRFNFHLVLFAIAFLFGKKFDSHILKLPLKEKNQPQFSKRQNLKEYFYQWLQEPERQKILSDTTNSKYPVYFVMANGGASRAGYWTSSLLSKLEDSSKGNFSKHLFCLSGASGGSVGNATFFSLLRSKDRLLQQDLSYTEATTQYLKSDFLTFTISHLLGPDIFRNFLPFLNSLEMDRGRALALSLEKAPAKNSFLYDSFAVKFSSLITQKGKSYPLPVICINATRMRDGAPAVFSNILIESNGMKDNYFNNRIDVLSKLGESRDINLSTAVVLGASFPYISPAGRIDNPYLAKNKKGEWVKRKESQYFVDGGYFDNSGAGVVNEMITALQNLMEKDSTFIPYKNKLEFFVIHIMNTDPKKINKDPINSLTNDLLAPAKTIMGSYGKQTTINDQRLKYYLYNLYNNEKHYTKIDLYDDAVSEFSYSMNWVFSERQKDTMNAALKRNTAFNNEMSRILSLR
ncbi:MAG TPA: patatin-like phospholipase family protein [Chitinophagaceae bacterium]|jgi:hypothetical protein|nr:patatin-like phospholipase family protein [Chitinophagaceae bacterium]